jgi:hypothetical protein
VRLRRLRVRLKTPTREGESEIYLLTNLPAEVEALIVAGLYRKCWTLEPMFSDFKSRGFGLEETQLQVPERLDRLILVMALAMYGCVRS